MDLLAGVMPEGYSLEQPLGSGDWFIVTRQFIRDNYWIPFTMSVVYISFVFGMQAYLKEKDQAYKQQWVKEQRAKGKEVTVGEAPGYSEREPAWVKPLLFGWNIFLGVFSMIGFFYTLRAQRASLAKNTFSQDMCNYDAESANPWQFLFVLSKVPELIDTVFLVCRRRPVILLHWYHHIATMLYCWDGWAHDAVNGSWFALLNLFVHSIMYTYYALTTYMRFPNNFRMVITILQLSQMLIGTAVVVHNFVVCPMGYPNYLVMGLIMYVSYFVLFAQLFYKNYCTSRAPRPRKPAAASDSKGASETPVEKDAKQE